MSSQSKKVDQAAINKLKELGTNLEQQHPVEFFLYFSEEWDAYNVGAQLLNLQFGVNISFSDHSGQWLCLATNKMKPTSERMLKMRGFLERLAESHDGEYDGWGTPMTNFNGQNNREEN